VMYARCRSRVKKLDDGPALREIGRHCGRQSDPDVRGDQPAERKRSEKKDQQEARTKVDL